MNISKQLANKLNSRFNQKQNELYRLPGVMGDGNGNLYHPTLNGYVYCKVANAVMPILNTRVPSALGLRVWVGYPAEEPGQFQILSTRTDAPAGVGGNVTLGYAPAKRYEWLATGGGQDPLHVHLRAFSPLKIGVSSTGGLNVNLYFGYIFSGGVYTYVAQQDIDMTSHIPATSGKAALVLVTINTSGTAVATKGSEVDIDALVLSDLPAIPASTAFVCGAVRVYEGQTVFSEMHTNTDFVDLRFPTYAGEEAYIAAVWGNITGNIDDQTDLQSALAAIGNGASQFEIPGVLAVTTSAAPAWLITGDTTISAWYIFCKVTGTGGGPTLVDVNKNGTTIYTSQANRPSLAWDDANGWAISGAPDVTTFVAGDIITIDIDQIATGAADLIVIPDIAQTAAGLQVRDAITTVNNVTELTGSTGTIISTTGTGKASIKAGLMQHATATGSTDITTASATFVDMTDMSVTITTGVATLDISFDVGVGHATNGGINHYGIMVDGVLKISNRARTATATVGPALSLHWTEDVAAGSHTIKAQWYTDSGTARNYAATGDACRSLKVLEFSR